MVRVPFPSLHSQRAEWDGQIKGCLPELLLARMLSRCCRTPQRLLTIRVQCHTSTQTLQRQKFSAQLTTLSSRCCWRLQNRQGPAGQLLGGCQTHGAPLPQVSKDRVPKYTSIRETFRCYKVMQAGTLKSCFGVYEQCLTPFLSGDKTYLRLPK